MCTISGMKRAVTPNASVNIRNNSLLLATKAAITRRRALIHTNTKKTGTTMVVLLTLQILLGFHWTFAEKRLGVHVEGTTMPPDFVAQEGKGELILVTRVEKKKL